MRHVPRGGTAVVFESGYSDAVAGCNIVEKEVAERMETLVAQRSRDGECTSVDLRACCRCDQCWNVAHGAADLSEQLRTLSSRRGDGQFLITRRRFESSDEASKVVHIGQTVGSGDVVGLSRSVAKRRHLVGK